MKLRQLTTLGPVSVHKCTKTLCKECGKPIAPGSVDGVCTVCRIKARTKKRQEEAAAKAKQLREEREAKKAAEEAAKQQPKPVPTLLRQLYRRCRPRRNRCGRFRDHSTDPGKSSPRRAGRNPCCRAGKHRRKGCARHTEKRLTAHRFNAILTIRPRTVATDCYKGVTELFPLPLSYPKARSKLLPRSYERRILLWLIPSPAASSCKAAAQPPFL